MTNKKILIIVPAFNEAGNIKKTIQEIVEQNRSWSVLVVNDGSLDETASLAKAAGACTISLPFNLGIGGAVQTGFKYALQEHYDIAVQVDGDGQHDAAYVEKLLLPIFNGQADMVIGSRFLPPYLGYRSSFIRRIGIHFFSHLISFLTENKVTDPTSGFRAYNQLLIAKFSAKYPHDFPEPEAIVLAKRCGARIIEVPVEMRKRAKGFSSIRYLRTLYYMIKVTFAILLDMLKKK